MTLSTSCSQGVRFPEPPHVQLSVNRLLFGGDVMFSRLVRRQMLAAHDPALPFRKIACTLVQGDLAFVNLEAPFSDRGPYLSEGLIFHSAPEAVAGLQLAGIAVVSTANNHARDGGAHGVEYTVDWLRRHGIQPVGSGRSPAETHAGVVEIRNGVRFGFLGYTYDQQNGNWHDLDERIALADVERMQADVRELKRRTDVVVVSMHHGIEYKTKPTAEQVRFAHAAIDAGASLVVGHHPHVVEPHEHYRNGWILYSLGNLVFDQFQRESTQHGEIAGVTFWGKQVLAVEAIPVRITSTGPELE